MQLYYIYDCESGSWQESQAEWVKEDIEKIPVKPVFTDDNQDDIDRLLTECEENTLFAYSLDRKKKFWRENNKYAVARWRVQLFEKQQTASIIADVFTVEFRKKVIMRNSSRQLILRLDYGRGKYTAIPSNEISAELGCTIYNSKWDWVDNLGNCNIDFEIYPNLPEIVGHRVMEFFKKWAKKEFGFVPTVPNNIPIAHLLRYFVQFPLDVNVGWCVDALGEKFKHRIRRDNASNFKLVCEYLNLQPTKSLRKAYHNDGRIMVLCYFLFHVGLQDVNAWLQFYGSTKLLGVDVGYLGLDMDKKRVRDYGMLYDKSACQWCYRGKRKYCVYPLSANISGNIYSLHQLVEWLLERWGTKRTGEIIYQINNNWDPFVDDSIRMWSRLLYLDNLEEGIIQYIYQNGFTRALHELMIDAINRAESSDKDKELLAMEYEHTPEELSRVEETPYGTFHIAHTGYDLKRVGMLFHNCVVTYAYRMKDGKCTIYYLLNEGKPLACIRVADRIIEEVKGPCNQILEGKALEAVKEWAERHELSPLRGRYR